MFADGVEAIGVEASFVGAIESLAELDVKDAETQTAGGFAIIASAGRAQRICADLGVDIKFG